MKTSALRTSFEGAWTAGVGCLGQGLAGGWHAFGGRSQRAIAAAADDAARALGEQEA